jgi:hypothetical protein
LHRELGLHIVWISHQTRDTQGAATVRRMRIDGDESHLPLVVDLGHPCQLVMGQAMGRFKKAHAQVFGLGGFKELPVLPFVFRPDWAQDDGTALP